MKVGGGERDGKFAILGEYMVVPHARLPRAEGLVHGKLGVLTVPNTGGSNYLLNQI